MGDRASAILVGLVAVLMLTTPVVGAVTPAQSVVADGGQTGVVDAAGTAGDGPTKQPAGDTPTNETGNDDETNTSDGGNETVVTADADANITTVEPDETEVIEVDREYDYEIPFRAETVTPEPGLDPAVTDSATERTWVVVQFVASPTTELLEEMTDLGYEDGGRLTRTARYASVPVDGAEDIAAFEPVRSVVDIEPAWRIDPDLAETIEAEESADVTVTTFEPIDTEGTPLREVEANTYRGTVTSADVESLAENPRVKWVEEFTAPAPTVSEGRRLVGAHMAERAGPGSRTGYDGTGVRVAVLDTGIQPNHPHFDDVNIIQGYDWVDNDGNSTTTARDHGQHVAGTIAGSGVNQSSGERITGVAEDATLIPSRIFDNTGITTVWTGPKRKYKKVNDEGADIISNSWGDTAESSDGDYDVEASKTDTWAYNHPDTLVVFANGNFNVSAANSGTVPANEQYVGSPGLAKNVISVGAIRDGSNSSGFVTDSSVGTVNADSFLNNLQPSRDMADNSNRRKPELYAPGHWIEGPLNSGYGQKLGTSMATPHVSGVAALLKDKYEHRSVDMDANAMRAELIATAAPPNHDGYGIVNANNALFENRYEARHAHMSGSVQNSGLFQSPSVEVDKKSFTVSQDTEKMVVALTWLDPGHQPTLQGSGSNILANDLDLVVEGPDGTHEVTTNSNVKRLVLEDPGQGKYTIKVRANRVTAFTNQEYDLVYRTVTDEPTLEVTDNQSETLQPWEDRQRWFNLSVEGTGAPVSGTALTLNVTDPGMSKCSDWDNATVLGILSEGETYEEDLCVEVPDVSTRQTVNVTATINTSNAASINGVQSRNLTVRKTFELLPPPEEDRFDDFGRDNDSPSAAADLTLETDWEHDHLFCVGGDRFSDGKEYGANCSGVVDGGDEVFAREFWRKELRNLSLHDDDDVDFYDIDVPETDTPKLPQPECGSQNVTIGGSQTEIETEGELVVQITATSNDLGVAEARTDPAKTPITVYDDGQAVSTGTVDWLYDSDVELTIDCPRGKGLEDLTVSFGEGPAKNIGGYEMDIYYRIDVKRVQGYEDAVRDRIVDGVQAEEFLENAFAYEQLPDVDDIDTIVEQFDEEGRPACYTHCGYPGGPAGRFDGEAIQFDVRNPQGDVANRFAMVTGDGGVTEFRQLENPAAFESTMRLETSVFATRLLSSAEEPGRALASAYRQGLVRFEGGGFLGGLYVGAPAVELGPEGDATVSVATTYDLTTDSGATAFESLQDDEQFRQRLTETFGTRMGWVADEWATRVDREMSVGDPQLTVDTREGGEVGVVSASVQWDGFAAVTDAGLRIDQPFAPSFVTDQPLELQAPDGYQLREASVEPVATEGRTVTWASGLDTGDLTVSLGTDSTETDGTDWPTFQRDAARSGSHPTAAGPVANVSERWNTSTSTGVSSSPAVVDDTVYVGNDAGDVLALDEQTGATDWQVTLDDSIRSAPTVVGDTVYVATRNSTLYALDTASGTQQWRFSTPGSIRNNPAVLSGPAVVAGTVYFGSTDGHVYAVDAATGTEQWATDTGDEVHSTPAVGDVTPDDGSASDGRTIYVGNIDGDVYALDAATGDVRWNRSTAEPVSATPTVDGSTMYVGNENGVVYALDVATGATEWTFQTEDYFVVASAALSGAGGDRVIVASGDIGSGGPDVDGHVYALDPATGDQLWRGETGGAIVSSPAVADGLVYVGSGDGNVYAFSASNGTEQWRYTTGGEDEISDDVTASPAVTNGTVVVGSVNDNVYALSGDTRGDQPVDLPPIETGGDPPADPDGDGTFEDVNGDGTANLFDALDYFNNRDSDTIENNPDRFDFDGDGEAGGLFDALALYSEISG